MFTRNLLLRKCTSLPFQPAAVSSHTATVIVQQPQPVVQLPRIWNSGLCSCFENCGTCLLGTFCPLTLACLVSQRLGESVCVPCCVPWFTVALSAKLRTQHNIQGSIMNDFAKATFCGPCVLCQLSNELDFIQRIQ